MRRVLVGAFIVGLALSITLAEAALFALIARSIWRLARGRARVTWPLAWPIAAFIATALLAAVLSAQPLDSLKAARGALLLLALWVLQDALPDSHAVVRGLRLLLAVLGIVAAFAVAQFTFCTEPWFVAIGDAVRPWWPALGKSFGSKCYRAHGFYSIYMTLAGVLNVALLGVLPMLLVPRALPRWAPIAWLVGVMGFALTHVRGAWLGFAAGVGVLVAVRRRDRLLLLVGLALLAVGLLLLPGVGRRARSLADTTDRTSGERVHMWKSGLAMLRDHPITGVGPGQVKRFYPQYAAAEVAHKNRGHLHSSPIQILVERGVPGLAAWLWVFATFFTAAARVARRADDPREHALVTGAIAAVAGFLAAGLFEHNFGDSEVLLVVLLLMAIVFVVEREAPRSELSCVA